MYVWTSVFWLDKKCYQCISVLYVWWCGGVIERGWGCPGGPHVHPAAPGDTRGAHITMITSYTPSKASIKEWTAAVAAPHHPLSTKTTTTGTPGLYSIHYSPQKFKRNIYHFQLIISLYLLSINNIVNSKTIISIEWSLFIYTYISR